MAGFTVSYGYWGYYLFKHYANPFFPYFNRIFQSPYFPSKDFYGTQYFAHGLVHTVFFPLYFIESQHLASDEFFRDPRLGVLLIMMMTIAAYSLLSHVTQKIPRPKVTREMVALLLFVVLSYVLWEKIYSYYRYVVIIEFLSLLVVTTIIWSIVHSGRLAALLSLAIALPVIFMTSPVNDHINLPVA